MLHRLAKLAMVIALACSIGLHWAFFQSLAWAGMVLTYSSDGSLKAALVKTFDGKHPCALCKRIAHGKRSEKKSELSLDLKKFEFLPVGTSFNLNAPKQPLHLAWAQDSPKTVTLAPPTPPPRPIGV